MYIFKYDDFLLEHSVNDPIPELTWNKKGKTAIFIFGAPGSGKSTFVNNHIIPKLKDYKIFDPDEIKKQLYKLGKPKIEKTEAEITTKMNDIKKTFDILRKKENIIVDISDDDIIKIITNNLDIEGSYEILENQLHLFMKNNKYADIIYDTTGNDYERIKTYTMEAKEHGYKILFIKVTTTINNAIMSNLYRKRKVQPDYQYQSILKSKKLERKYLELQPDAYYIYDRDNLKINKIE